MLVAPSPAADGGNAVSLPSAKCLSKCFPCVTESTHSLDVGFFVVAVSFDGRSLRCGLNVCMAEVAKKRTEKTRRSFESGQILSGPGAGCS